MDILAFIDESGDPYYTSASSNLLVYSAIIVIPHQEKEINEEIKKIKSKLNIKEIKSSRIKTEGKRLDLLKKINKLPIKTITIVIQKPEVQGEWIKYWKSFYKRTQKLLHRELYVSYKKTFTKIDKYSGRKYQDSLKKYFENQIQTELWDSEVFVESAKINEIIQVADLIAGTTRKIHSNDFKRTFEIDEQISKNNLITKVWPKDYKEFVIEEIIDEKDRNITNATLTITKKYLSEIPEDDPKSIVLNYLLFEIKYGQNDRFIYTHEFLTLLNENGFQIKEEEFRVSIIGAIRSAGVPICGSNKGLKLPTKISDMLNHFEYTSNKFLPMIRRVKISIDSIKKATLGQVDFYDFEETKEFVKLLKSISV